MQEDRLTEDEGKNGFYLWGGSFSYLFAAFSSHALVFFML